MIRFMWAIGQRVVSWLFNITPFSSEVFVEALLATFQVFSIKHEATWQGLSG